MALDVERVDTSRGLLPRRPEGREAKFYDYRRAFYNIMDGNLEIITLKMNEGESLSIRDRRHMEGLSDELKSIEIAQKFPDVELAEMSSEEIRHLARLGTILSRAEENAGRELEEDELRELTTIAERLAEGELSEIGGEDVAKLSFWIKKMSQNAWKLAWEYDEGDPDTAAYPKTLP